MRRIFYSTIRIRLRRKRPIKIKAKILAICEHVPARFPNPKIDKIADNIKNTIA